VRVLGCAVRAGTLRCALVERGPAGAAVHAFVQRELEGDDGLAAALREVSAQTGTQDVAFALSPPDVLIVRFPAGDGMPPRDVRRAARLRAEALGFGARDRVELVEGRSGQRYVAVAHRSAVAAVAGACRAAGVRLVFLDHEAYAWGAVIGRGAQALVVVRDDAVRLVVAGSEQVQMGTFAWTTGTGPVDRRAIAAAVADAVVDAAKAGFVDVDHVAVDDPAGRVLDDLVVRLAPATVTPFALEVDPSRTDWALACGIALRAIAGPGRRLRVDFAAGGGRARRAVGLPGALPTGDLVTLGLGVIAAVGLVGWRAETLRELQVRSAVLERQLAGARSASAGLDRATHRLSVARGVVTLVDGARLSAPEAARAVAAVAERMRPGVSISSLAADEAGWHVAGHAASYPAVAALVQTLASRGYRPSVSGLSNAEGRIGYSVTLRGPSP
jgi:hypothetical protein